MSTTIGWKEPKMSYVKRIKRNGKIYLAEVESKRIDGKVVQRHIRYLGKEADGKTILSSSISNISIEEIKIHGPLIVLNYFCEKIGLSEILGEYGDELLSLVFAHCIDYKSVNQMSRWFKRTDLNMILNLEKLTEDRIFKALDSIQEENNIEQIETEIFDKIKAIYAIDTTGIIYDVTNTYLYGKQCPFGQFGKDKEGVKGRPLIQIGLGVTKEDGIPIFHKTFNGNISDSRTFHDLITSFKKYNIRSGIIIYDRGITSGNNIKYVKKLKWDTICGLAANNKLKEIARKIILENKLIDIKKRIKLNHSIFYVFSQEYEIEDTKGTLLICYNDQKAKDIRESRYDEVKNAQELNKNGEQIKSGLEKYFYANGNINYKVITQEEEFDGISFVFSTKKMRTDEIMRLYFHDKDIIEKAFQSLKGIVKIRPIRHWLYNRVRSHIFICYLSYLLLSLLKLSLKKIKMSPIKALKELDSLYKVYIKDKEKGFELSRTVALTKVQEKILKTIDKELLLKCSG
jgi:transposase